MYCFIVCSSLPFPDKKSLGRRHLVVGSGLPLLKSRTVSEIISAEVPPERLGLGGQRERV